MSSSDIAYLLTYLVNNFHAICGIFCTNLKKNAKKETIKFIKRF